MKRREISFYTTWCFTYIVVTFTLAVIIFLQLSPTGRSKKIIWNPMSSHRIPAVGVQLNVVSHLKWPTVRRVCAMKKCTPKRSRVERDKLSESSVWIMTRRRMAS
jgi:hypothetical protein